MAEAGAAAAVDGIVDSFLESSAKRTEAMTVAVENGNLTEAARLAHAFRSSAAQLGAHRLADWLKDIEAAAKASDADKMREAFNGFLGEAERVVTYLRNRG